MIEYMKEYYREDIWLDEYKSLNQKETPLDKAKRIRRIKKAIIIIVFALIVIPIILSIVLFLKVNSLQKQIDMLMIDKYDMTYAQMNNINYKNKFIKKYKAISLHRAVYLLRKQKNNNTAS